MFQRLAKRSAKNVLFAQQKQAKNVFNNAKPQMRQSSNRSDFQEGVIFTGQFGIDVRNKHATLLIC